MHLFRKLCATVAMAAILAAAASPAVHAQNIITVTAPATSYYVLNGDNDEAYASSWSDTSAYDNVSISAVLANQTGSNANGTAYLTTAIGASATAADLVSSQNFTIPSSAGVAGDDVSLFSGLSLAANQTYYLVLNVDEDTGFELGWVGGDPPTASTAPGVTYGLDYLTGKTITTYPYNSAWSPSTDYDNGFEADGTTPEPNFGLEYSVQGDPLAPVVPESSSLALILPSVLALAGLALFTRRRRSLQA